MRNIRQLSFGCILAVAATSALSWGPREQAALAGLVVGAAVTTIAAGENNTAPPTIIVPQPQYPVAVQPVYAAPAPPPIQPQLVCGVNVVCSQPMYQPYPTYRPTCTQVPVRDVYGRFYRWDSYCY